MATKLFPSKRKEVGAFALKLDVTTEYYLERVLHTGTPMFIPIRDNLIIGRGICDAPHISRKHAMFQKSSIGCWFVKDLGSVNGIYKNKNKLLPNCLHCISVGDYIGLGAPECEDNNQYLFLVGVNKNLRLQESELNIEIIPPKRVKMDKPRKNNNEEDKPRKNNNEVDKPRKNNNEVDKQRENNNEVDKQRENNNEVDKQRENNNEVDKPRKNDNEVDKPRKNDNEVDKPLKNDNEVDKPLKNDNEVDKPLKNDNEVDKPLKNDNEVDKPLKNDNEVDKPLKNDNEADKPRENNNEADKPRKNNNEEDEPRKNNNEEDKPRKNNNEVDKLRVDDSEQSMPELFGPFYDGVSDEKIDDLSAIRPVPRNCLPLSATVLTNAVNKTIQITSTALGPSNWSPKKLNIAIPRPRKVNKIPISNFNQATRSLQLTPQTPVAITPTYSHMDDIICLDEDDSIFFRPIKIESDNLFPPEESRAKPGNNPSLSATYTQGNINTSNLQDEFQAATSAHVTEKPRTFIHPKNYFEQFKQMSSSSSHAPVVTPIVSCTPRHTYTADIYLAMVLKWNVNWLKQQEINSEPPPLKGKEQFHFRCVTTHYNSADEYFETYFPLIVLETWEIIFRDWKRKIYQTQNFESPSFVITKFNAGIGSTLGEIVLESVIEYKHLNHYVTHYKEGMLIIFKMIEPRASTPTHLNWSLAFGYINRLKCSIFNKMSNENSQLLEMPALKTPTAQHIVLNVKIRPRYGLFKYDKFLQLQPVTFLRPTLRQVQSLSNLHKSSLARYILTPHTSAMNVSVFPGDRFVPVGSYNSLQQRFILGAGYAGLLPESTPKIVLLQGPPGTGKTHTCVGLIQQLLYGHSYQNTKRRLLVLAPSNAAIDEITRRLIELKPSIDADHPDSPISLVRVGHPETMHCDIRAYSLDEIALRKTENECNFRTSMLQAEINDLSTIIRSKLSLKLPVQQEQAQMALLHEKMINNNVQKAKDSENLANNKKEIITNTSIILTTLINSQQSIMEQVFGPGAKPLKFTACIVDEAAQCSEPELLLPLQYEISKLILIGDPMQLPVTVLSRKAASLNFQKSLFERFQDYYLTRESPIVILNEQYRMHSCICSFPSKYFYHDALYTSPGIDTQLADFPPYILLDIAKEGYQNENEAIIIQNLCQSIMMGIPNHCSIGIITPNEEQRDILTKHFSSSNDVRFEINTVNGFQGRENDITILSCIMANDKVAIEFFKCPRRLNVAITRARQALIICGNLQSLLCHEHWKRLIEDANARNLIFKNLKD